MGLAVKTLIAILVVTIILSATVFIWRENYQREWQGTEQQQQLGSEKSGFTDFKSNLVTPKYILWIGDVITTLDILNLAQQHGIVIQPIYITDPANSQARSEYELEITRSLRAMINTKYQQSHILPIISITRDKPDDTAFNHDYDYLAADVASDTPTRENILRRWAKYYKLEIAQSNSMSSHITKSTNQYPSQQQTLLTKQKQTQKQKQKSNANILSETWNCRFPVGANGTPCGLCKKCEKLNDFAK